MEKYLLEIKKTGGQIVVGYRKGCLVYLDIKETVTSLQVAWVHKNVPQHYEGFTKFVKEVKSKGVAVSEVLTDLSFENFWNIYDNKKGKKVRVERIWKDMSDVEKSKALDYIKKYNYYLAINAGIQKKYPQTYLNCAEWNN